ncbi:hypothetical protein [Bacteroides sp.]
MKKLMIISLLLCTAFCQAKTKFDRGITKSVFVPKGQWFMGSTISYSEQSADKYQFLVLADIDAKGYTFRFSPFGGYCFADNMAAGARFTYSRTYIDIGNVDINLGDDLSFQIKDDMYLEHNYSATGFLRTYMGLGNSKVFGFFNEVRLTYKYGQGKHSNGKDNDMTGYYQASHCLEIGVAPGLAAFVSDFASVEVSVGVMGFDFKWVNQTHNQVKEASRRGAGGNFKIDLFSINLGMTMYF